jgi:hydrogenase expression/formation protein HypD
VTIVPSIKAILDSPGLQLDGFLGACHVSTVIGCRPYDGAISLGQAAIAVVRSIRHA